MGILKMTQNNRIRPHSFKIIKKANEAYLEKNCIEVLKSQERRLKDLSAV